MDMESETTECYKRWRRLELVIRKSCKLVCQTLLRLRIRVHVAFVFVRLVRAHLLAGGGIGKPARMRWEKSGASPAACARALMWLSRLSAAKGRRVSSRPISYAYSGAYPLKSIFQLYRAMPPDARAWNRIAVVQLVVSVL